MTRVLPSLRFTGAQVLRDKALTFEALAIEGGAIVETAERDVDLTGYLVLPGILDMQVHDLGRYVLPRPGTRFPTGLGLSSVDRTLSTHGVTTAWLTHHWSWEGGLRSPDHAKEMLAALATYRPRALSDLRAQIRCETQMPETRGALIDTVRRFNVDLVVFNNILPEVLQMVTHAPHRLAHWAERDGGQLEDFIARARAAKAQTSVVPRHLNALAAAFDELGVLYGSHGDPDGETRDLYHALGAHICLCPQAAKAASVARVWGDTVVMGASDVIVNPNRPGHLSARALIAHGQCDVLVSNGHFPALPAAAWTLSDAGIFPFARAWEMLSSNPARVMKLSDRGDLTLGKRADLVIINTETRDIEATICAGRPSYIAGEVFSRMISVLPHSHLAAE